MELKTSKHSKPSNKIKRRSRSGGIEKENCTNTSSPKFKLTTSCTLAHCKPLACLKQSRQEKRKLCEITQKPTPINFPSEEQSLGYNFNHFSYFSVCFCFTATANRPPQYRSYVCLILLYWTLRRVRSSIYNNNPRCSLTHLTAMYVGQL